MGGTAPSKPSDERVDARARALGLRDGEEPLAFLSSVLSAVPAFIMFVKLYLPPKQVEGAAK